MRISPWAVKFNVGIQSATVLPGQQYYRIEDVFTTINGSWEPSTAAGSITDWARATYLKPWGSPDYFDDAGADHHALAGIYDPNARAMTKGTKFRFYTWTDNGNSVLMPSKEKSGWANVLMFNSFAPDLDDNPNSGERGAWAWRPEHNGLPAETFLGGGMPLINGYKMHISFFVTWVLDVATGEEPPVDTDLEKTVQDLEDWAVALGNSLKGKYPEVPLYDPNN